MKSEGQSATTRRWILAATILGSAMAFIDGTVVNIALPVLQKALTLTVRDALWIVDSYLLVLSSLLLAGGALGDHFGRTRMFAVGVTIFALASAWAGAAPAAGPLIAARALQGLGGALLVPGSLSIITATFPAAERGRAIGTWSGMTSLAAIAGPLLGGWLVQSLSWRSVFYINLPIAAATLLIVFFIRGSEEPPGAGPIDWAGTLLTTMALGALTYALIERAPLWVYGVSAAAFTAFVLVERRLHDPIVPLALFRSRAFTISNVLTLLLYAALSAVTFLLPFNLIQIQGYSPAQAGAAFLPFVATMSLLSRWTGALADRIGPRLPLTIGPLAVAAGFVLMSRPGIGGSYWTTFFPAILAIGIGMAITVAPLTTTVMTSTGDEDHAGAASGINNTVARAAGLLAIALFGVLSVVTFSRALDGRLAHEEPAIRQAMAAQHERLAQARPPRDADAATRKRVETAIAEAFVRAFRFNMIAAAALAVAGAGAGLAVGGVVRSPRATE
jgi:EmrB/QacA subfamily drug resistance transporter